MTDRPNWELHACILRVLSSRPSVVTYVLRNHLDWPDRPFGDWSGLTTDRVLRGCRRLEKRGLIKEARSAYAVMKCWEITDAGRTFLGYQDLNP